MSPRDVQLISHAGAGVVRPEPSRHGSLIEESHPLQVFIEAIPEMRRAMVSCGAPAFAYSPLNALPKLALGKWEAERDAAHNVFLLSDEDTDRVVPLGTIGQYYGGVMERLERGRTVSLVPEHIANHLKGGGFKVAKQHDEYVMLTEDVQTFPGGRNRQMRGNVNKAKRLCDVETFDPDRLAEYKGLVRTWYRQNADLKFRTYDKTSIDWLLENWPALAKAVPDLRCLGIRHDEQLVSLNMGCLLTEEHWTAYTQRFDRNAPVKHANMLGYQSLAHAFWEVGRENDGTADTKTIREWKDRLVTQKITFYTVRR